MVLWTDGLGSTAVAIIRRRNQTCENLSHTGEGFDESIHQTNVFGLSTYIKQSIPTLNCMLGLAVVGVVGVWFGLERSECKVRSC
jgi:hypothetical protein